jgi:hypothetical protein
VIPVLCANGKNSMYGTQADRRMQVKALGVEHGYIVISMVHRQEEHDVIQKYSKRALQECESHSGHMSLVRHFCN